MSVPAPTCCEYAKAYITLFYDYCEASYESKEWFLNNKPHWFVRGAKIDDMARYTTNPEDRPDAHIKYCPSCGKELPEIRKKKKPLKKVVSVTDGGYYCDTCKKRLMECQCHRPEEMWEVV